MSYVANRKPLRHRGGTLADTLTRQQRSERMRLIKNKNTQIEWIVRRLLFAAGYRYKVHCNQLPGNPDIVFSRRKIAIFVHGCFWHGHVECKIAHTPKSRPDYWREKFERNIQRDQKNNKFLVSKGWKVITVWECETNNVPILEHRLVSTLGPPKWKPHPGRKHVTAT